jgi:hypothetical protein
MDPISAAGIGLGVASLALQLFSGCIQGYQIFLDAAGMPEDFEHLRVRMRIEQVRLLNWGEKAGLLEDMLEQPSVVLQLHRNLIIDILFEIQRLFKGCLKIKEKFDNLMPVRRSQTADLVVQDSNSVSPRGINALLRRTLKVLEKTPQVPKRLQWAIVEQDKFEELIEKLISYNDSVVSLLDRASIDQLHEMQVQTQLVMLQLSNKIDDLKQLSLAMQVKTNTDTQLAYAYKSTWSISATATSRSDDGTSLSQLAIFKVQQTSIESHSLDQSSRPIDRKLVTLASSSTSRSQATYRGEQVWVEWKEWDLNHQLPTWDSMIEERVKKLAALLSLTDKPKEFRAPICVGYFDERDEDTARYGLIYNQPDNSAKAAVPTSLLDLIKTSEEPSLTQRTALAHTLTQSLLYLHSVNWLHKGFRSDNIVFFTSPNQTPDYATPIVSGFEYARPDLPEELTEKPAENFSHDLYRHPDALANPTSRSKKSWDIYSLGIVLFEIALWQPISSIVSVHEGQKGARTKLRKTRDRLLEDAFLRKLGARVGERYRDVVRRCIAGGASLGISDGTDESDPNVGADMLQVFSAEIVGKLAGIQL